MKFSKGKLLPLIGLSLLLSACHDSDNDNNDGGVVTPPPPPVTMSYRVTVTNLTNGQPLSPVGVVVHNGQFDGWTLGQPASAALETLAEGGDASAFITGDNVLSGAVGSDAVGPGGSGAIEVTINESSDVWLTVATMLVNTNDAFTGVDGWDLSNLAVGESLSRSTRVYDSGTEGNSEAVGTIPGPVDGGEGANTDRDDVDFVAMHPGVVSQDDGLSSSILTEAHRFDSVVARIRVERTN